MRVNKMSQAGEKSSKWAEGMEAGPTREGKE